MKTVESINSEIDRLQQAAGEVLGKRCEVFARVCGYYRATESWNEGKKEEEADRLPFDVEGRCG